MNQGPPSLEGAAFASDGHKAWLMGGIESGGAYSRSTWEYVVGTNRWVQREDLPQPLAYGSAAFVANLPASSAVTAQVGPASAAPGPGLLWFGGRTSAGTAVSATYGYEPRLGTEVTLYAGSGRTLTYIPNFCPKKPRFQAARADSLGPAVERVQRDDDHSVGC